MSADKNEVVPVGQVVPARSDVTPFDLLQKAIDSGADLDKLERLMVLHREYLADRAREAFDFAMTVLKSKAVVIDKDKHVKFQTSKGTTEYKHATLAAVVDAVVLEMSAVGLSHRWEMAQSELKVITVACVVRHRLGHSERTVLSSLPDDSGGKNSIQAVASTVTYLQRYTLMAALGLAARDMAEDDGAGASLDPISKEQAATLRKKIDDSGADKVLFLEWARVDKIEDIAAKDYDACMAALDRKAKGQK